MWPTPAVPPGRRRRRPPPWRVGMRARPRPPTARGRAGQDSSPRDRLPTRRQLLPHPSRRRVRRGPRPARRWPTPPTIRRRGRGRQPGRRCHKHHGSPTNPRPPRLRHRVRPSRLPTPRPTPRVIRRGVSNLRCMRCWVRPVRTPRPPRRRRRPPRWWPSRCGRRWRIPPPRRRLRLRSRSRPIVGPAHRMRVWVSCRRWVLIRGVQRLHRPFSFPSSMRPRPLPTGMTLRACRIGREVWSQTVRRQPWCPRITSTMIPRYPPHRGPLSRMRDCLLRGVTVRVSRRAPLWGVARVWLAARRIRKSSGGEVWSHCRSRGQRAVRRGSRCLTVRVVGCGGHRRTSLVVRRRLPPGLGAPPGPSRRWWRGLRKGRWRDRSRRRLRVVRAPIPLGGPRPTISVMTSRRSVPGTVPPGPHQAPRRPALTTLNQQPPQLNPRTTARTAMT